ncbi:pali-domain-containing protein [Gloeophyllum trabeum ATCC 11539]|uniref:Pali-domain-containing protein n=1 Tax=Gloeophyllum trabeum (strain ATCC 11539 / FP-39264 / Madison 617) TaxID=670483 RepID=S7Q6E5_GLOTA|nr:pali-domain-containing protein [Gloeophyllum trabeum ATCC 11539]EPQ55636.1 pali-domain-containing protein [Gloeophyllum trabeum ATCC 11539]
MVSRAFCIPGIVFLLAAFVLSFLTSISLPYLPALDIATVHFGNGQNSQIPNTNVPVIKELRFGIWAYCEYAANDGHRTCSPEGHGYQVQVGDATNNDTVTIGSSWTRGLAVHPVATAVTFIALLLSFSTHVTVTLLASIVSFLAALLTLIAFAIDIALYAYVHHEMGKLSGSVNTDTAPGFWLTFVSLILLLLAGCTVCFGRRRERMSGSSYGNSYPMSTKRRFWPFNRS